MTEDDRSGELKRRLRQAGGEELLRLVEERAGELDPEAVRHTLRNPHAGARVVERLLGERRLLTFYEVRRELAGHPRTPQVQALRLVGGLYWRDLVALSADSRLRPVVRRTAERRLAERLPGLAVGEKMAIARAGGAGVVSQLRHDPDPRVVGALLDNPRLTEGALLPLLTSDGARPEVLKVVARHRKWGLRHAVRVAVCRNRRTPSAVVLPLLPGLKRTDLEAVAADPRLDRSVRRRANLLLGRSELI